MSNIQKITNITLFIITIILTAILIVNFFDRLGKGIGEDLPAQPSQKHSANSLTIEQIEEILQKHLGSPSEKEKFKEDVLKIIEEFLQQHPEKINEALERIAAKKQDRQKDEIKTYIEENKDAIFSDEAGIIFSDGTGPQIVFFFDYNCGYCKRGLEYMKKLLARRPDIKVILKPLPVLGAGSMNGAQFILSIKKLLPEKEQELNNAMFKEKTVNAATLERIAANYEITKEQLANMFSDIEIQVAIGDNLELAEKLKIRGAPAYIIEGKAYSGMMDDKKIESLLPAALRHPEDKPAEDTKEEEAAAKTK